MKLSWKLGTVFGATVRIHATFPLLLLWIAAVEFAGGSDWPEIIAGVAFTPAMLASVVCHEFGHALAARTFGVHTRDITLLPVGGVAKLDRLPRRTAHELWISLAGPAVNGALAILLLALHAATEDPLGAGVTSMNDGFVVRLAWANVALALFNLLPASPMDGGRILRAVLALQIDPVRATDLAVFAGKALAALLGVVGIATHSLLVMIAVFVWFGTELEAGVARLRTALEGVPVEDVMMTEFHVLAADDELRRAVDFALAGGQKHFPVAAEGAVVGMLSWQDLLSGLAASGSSARVGDKMQRPARCLHESDLVEKVLDREREERIRAMPVLREGRIVGLFTPENLAESAALRSAAERSTRRSGPDFAVDDRPRSEGTL